MMIYLPILKNNTETHIVVNVNHIVAISDGINGNCVLLSTGEELTSPARMHDIFNLLWEATGKQVASLYTE